MTSLSDLVDQVLAATEQPQPVAVTLVATPAVGGQPRPIGSKVLGLATDFVDERWPWVIWKIGTKCAEDGKRFSNQLAHAHCSESEFGLVCIRKDVKDDDVTRTHEVAHLLNPELRERHGKGWRKIVSDLGHPEEAERYFNHRAGNKRTRFSLFANGTYVTQWLIPMWRFDDPMPANHCSMEPSEDLLASLKVWAKHSGNQDTIDALESDSVVLVRGVVRDMFDIEWD